MLHEIAVLLQLFCKCLALLLLLTSASIAVSVPVPVLMPMPDVVGLLVVCAYASSHLFNIRCRCHGAM